MTTPNDEPVGSPGVVITSGKFVRKGFILRDLLLAMQAEEPSVNAQTLKNRLAITQDCDFEEQLRAAIASSSEDSLAAFIRQYVRDNSSDTTELPAMARYYLNAASAEAGSAAVQLRREADEAAAHFRFPDSARPVDYLATKNPAWRIEDGAIVFTRRAEIMVCMDLYARMDVAGVSAADVQWRFSNTGTNRLVTLIPTVHLEGALTTGSQTDIALQQCICNPEVYPNATVPVSVSFRLKVLDSTGRYGRVDRMRLSLQRSAWVAKGPNGQSDRIYLPKRTPTGTPDTTNFIELIEL